MPERARERGVAILGAGIMGSCLALFLARLGLRVTLYEQEAAPLRGASRWNEGKIHLGYLYGADPTLATAKHLIPGGLAFAPLLRELLDTDIDACITPADDLFLIHRDSVINVEQARHYYRAVTELVRQAPDARQYLADVSAARTDELSATELADIGAGAVVSGGFRVPERSVQTNWIADRLCAALLEEPRIELRTATTVTAVHSTGKPDDSWQVISNANSECFAVVVNALWQNRLTIDKTAGIAPPAEWSNRYRLALFVRTARPVQTPSAVLAVGPFGDIKNYNDRDFYLSWYPAGLVYASDSEQPAADFALEAINPRAIEEATRVGLSEALSGARDILDASEKTGVAGGWVFAQGRGQLSSPGASLHRRDRFGVCRLGSYYSIDTGKYSLAPWLARSLAGEIAGR